MYFVCSDLEGIFIPEIWEKIAKKTKIEELKITTKECPDFNFLMEKRIKILKENNLNIYDLEKIVRGIEPFRGAVKILEWIRKNFQLLIISDSFYDFIFPLLKKLNFPLVFCNSFIFNKRGLIIGYKRIKKKEIVRFLKKMKMKVIAIGDSYNDLEMLKEADFGILFKPAFKGIKKKIKVAKNYSQLKNLLVKFL